MVENNQYQAEPFVSTQSPSMPSIHAVLFRATGTGDDDQGESRGVSRPTVRPWVRGSQIIAPRLPRGLFVCLARARRPARRGRSGPRVHGASPAPPLQATPAGVASPAGSGSFTPAATPEPQPSSTFPPGSGARVYAENCAGCHGARGEGYVGPPLAPAGFASLVAPMVEQGGINMPPFAGVLSDQDVNAVAEYVAQELADPEARTAEVSPRRRPLPPVLRRLPQRDRQRRRDGGRQQRAQHPPVPGGRGARRHDPRPRQHAGVRRQHVRRAAADLRRALRPGARARPAVARRARASATSGRCPRAPSAASRSCC